jgi:hypothetical protein
LAPYQIWFQAYKQPSQTFNLIIHYWVKEEVERVLDAGFIQHCQYAKWVSNIVAMEKKNTGKIWVCIDFRNSNKATPKDEYPMPIADMLINNASRHRIISFLDGNACYNIFMVEEAMSKMAFCCVRVIYPRYRGLPVTTQDSWIRSVPSSGIWLENHTPSTRKLPYLYGLKRGAHQPKKN